MFDQFRIGPVQEIPVCHVYNEHAEQALKDILQVCDVLNKQSLPAQAQTYVNAVIVLAREGLRRED